MDICNFMMETYIFNTCIYDAFGLSHVGKKRKIFTVAETGSSQA